LHRVFASGRVLFPAKPYQIRLKSDVFFYLVVITTVLLLQSVSSTFLRMNPFLLDREGNIRWQGQGTAKAEDVKALIETAQGLTNQK
jgi:hypothetical protein